MFNIEDKIRIAATEDGIWDILTNPERARALFPDGLHCETVDYGGIINGKATIGSRVFELRMKAYDVELFDSSARVGLRVKPKNGFCTVLAAAVCADEQDSVRISEKLGETLLLLKIEAEEPESAAYAPPDEETDASEFSYYDAPREEASERFRRPEKQKRSGKRIMAALVTVAVLAGAVLGGYLAWNRISGASSTEGRGGAVTLENALSIETGESKSQVAWRLGTNGQGEDAVIYKSADDSPTGEAARQICVRYENERAAEVTYLDLEQCSKLTGEIAVPSGVGADMTAQELAEAVGMPVSMYRKSENGAEYHFGYLDPFANFDPAWRGTLEIIIPTDGGAAARQWTPYYGSDALMQGSLDERLSRQYDSYTDFLNDKFESDRALEVFRMQLSRGDLQKALGGTLTEYNAVGGTKLYELSETGETSKITAGLDFDGRFRVASYVNLRLFERENVLDKETCERLSSGMAYNEVRSILGVLPTSITVNSASVTMGYGRYLGASKPELQFEAVIKYDIVKLAATSVYLNFEGGGAEWGFADGEDKSE